MLGVVTLLLLAIALLRPSHQTSTSAENGPPRNGPPRNDPSRGRPGGGRPAPAPPASDDPAALRAARPPILPDTTMTPGATLDVTAQDICVPGYSKRVRNVPSSVKRQAYDEYGIASREPGEYEVDHLISLQLGGSNSIRNLWPQSFRTQPWNARVKDRLENELHRLVCAGQLDLATAQEEIAGNWVVSYRKRIGAPPGAN
ncbi:hypothetical protein tb265_16810 [Gemmatimonadetes bacterium T265]|nr:hypothetical protein tb265_16810 [Gemmatimonadetes bacterium T265]